MRIELMRVVLIALACACASAAVIKANNIVVE
jgi:hypothetical protein